MAKKRQRRASDKPSVSAAESKIPSTEATDDWISALAKKATVEAARGDSSSVPSKKERIERRNAKKRRRQERKPAGAASSKSTNIAGNSMGRDHGTQSRGMNPFSKHCLERIARQIQTCSAAEENQGRRKPYQCPESLKRGKATSGGKWTEESIQPRKRDYGGLGIARPSLYLSLRDQSFVPRLEEEFSQHIPGFFGKQRTKAMKRQLDGNMLWRRLAEKKTDTQKIQGKKLSDMTPDERVEAMINAGML